MRVSIEWRTGSVLFCLSTRTWILSSRHWKYHLHYLTNKACYIPSDLPVAASYFLRDRTNFSLFGDIPPIGWANVGGPRKHCKGLPKSSIQSGSRIRYLVWGEVFRVASVYTGPAISAIIWSDDSGYTRVPGVFNSWLKISPTFFVSRSSPKATYSRLIYSTATDLPRSCIRTVNGSATYQTFGWYTTLEHLAYLFPLTLINLVSCFIIAMAVYKPHISADDPTDPEKLLAATRKPTSAGKMMDIVDYRNEVRGLLCKWFYSGLNTVVGFRRKTLSVRSVLRSLKYNPQPSRNFNFGPSQT